MKIQLQNTAFYPAVGGIENYLYYASRTLLKMKHKPIILCSQHKPNLLVKDIYHNIQIIRYPAYHLPKPLFAFDLMYYIKRLQKFITDNSKDVDAIWSRHPYCAYASCKALQRTPIIYIQATVWPSLLRYAFPNLDGIRSMAFRIKNLQNYYVEKKAMEMCHKIVVLSKIRMREISDYYNFPKEKFEVIQPGIDLERFKPTERAETLLQDFGISKNAKIVLSVCRLSPEKNIEMLINAFAKINLTDTHLVIIGDGPQKPYLEQLIRKLNLINKVKFLGFRKDVERFYSIADVFVLPSKYEGFGHVYLEAMASGVPCIGLKNDYPKVIVASEEIIEEGVTGFTADPYSVDDLADKIEKIISDEKLKQTMGEKGRKACEEKYSWTDCVEKLLQVSKVKV